ncbi:MAG: FAD binding domain-containing protein [Erysipelotrichaceae bacterium]
MVKVLTPIDLNEALENRSELKTLVYNGGTDLMVKYRSWSSTDPKFPNDLLYIGDLKELQTIEIFEDKLVIGAGVKLADIIQDVKIPEYIKRPLRQMGSPAVRNLGTLGGNICNASPAGDSLPMLYALDATVTLASSHGSRLMKVSDFIHGPGKTELASDEILTYITIPLVDFNRFTYSKVGSRKANAISKLSFYGAVVLEEKRIKQVRIAFGAVGPTVIRCEAAEHLLEGADVTEIPELDEAFISHYEKLVVPIDDVRSTRDYRKTTAMQLLDEFIKKELIK